MLKITRTAKESEEVATKKGRKLDTLTRVAVTGSTKRWYGWKFVTHCIGYTTDGNPEPGYSKTALIKDVTSLVGVYKVDALRTIINGGIDLHDRAKAPPKAPAKMKDADKVQWVCGEGCSDDDAKKELVMSCLGDTSALLNLYEEWNS